MCDSSVELKNKFPVYFLKETNEVHEVYDCQVRTNLEVQTRKIP